MGDPIKDLPASERPRERLKRHGPGSLSDAELLAILIRTGSTRSNVKQLCTQLLTDLGLQGLQKAGIEKLKEFDGIGDVKAGQLAATFELATRLQHDQPDTATSFQDAKQLFIPRLRGKQQEELHAAFLSPSNRIITVEQVFKGSLRGIQIDNRDVVRKALQTNASAVILAHNHPGGRAEPTQADVQTTRAIERDLDSFDIRLLDHIIVGETGCCSLKRQGQL